MVLQMHVNVCGLTGGHPFDKLRWWHLGTQPLHGILENGTVPRGGRWGGWQLPIQLVPLPTYASWCNPIEKLWRQLRQELLHLHRFADRFRSTQWPQDRPLPEVYYDPRSLEISTHEKSALHAHPDSVFYLLTPMKARFSGGDGTAVEAEFPAGAVWRDAETHAVENIGANEMRGVAIELK